MKDRKKRLSAEMKAEVVLRYLKGEGLDIQSREYQLPAFQIMEWKQIFINNDLRGF